MRAAASQMSQRAGAVELVLLLSLLLIVAGAWGSTASFGSMTLVLLATLGGLAWAVLCWTCARWLQRRGAVEPPA